MVMSFHAGKIYLTAILVLLALSGAAEAAIASSGGGLSSTVTGSSIVQSGTDMYSGHSAYVSREVHVDQEGAGHTVLSASGSNSAIDPENGASVSVTGRTSALVTITGTGTGAYGLADAVVSAESVQEEGYYLVETIISSALDLNAPVHTTVTGKAQATGHAAAQWGAPVGTMFGNSFSSSVSGNTVATGSITSETGLCEPGLRASSQIEASAQLAPDGSGGSANAHLWSAIGEGNGFGTASTSTSGAVAQGLSVWDTGSEIATVAGSSSLAASNKKYDNYLCEIGIKAGESDLGITGKLRSIIFEDLMIWGGELGSSTLTGSSSGTAHDIYSESDPYLNEPSSFDTYVSGSVAGSAAQAGYGVFEGHAFLEASTPYQEDHKGLWWYIPMASYNSDTNSITPLDIGIDARPLQGVSSAIESRFWTKRVGVSPFKENGRLSATGTATATGTFENSGGGGGSASPSLGLTGDGRIFATTVATVQGTAAIPSLTAAGNVLSLEGRSDIRAIATTGGGNPSPLVIKAGSDSYEMSMYTNAGTVSTVDTHGVSYCGAGDGSEIGSSSVTTSATGTASASSDARNVMSSDWNDVGEVSSAASAAGTVTGQVKNNGGRAETGSSLWGLSSSGSEISNYPSINNPQGLQIIDFGYTDSTLISGSLVLNPGTGKTSANGAASGSTSSTASEADNNRGFATYDSFFVTSSSSATQVASGITATRGEGDSTSSVGSEGLTGTVGDNEIPGVGQMHEIMFPTGISTTSSGRSTAEKGSVSGTTSVTRGVAQDSGSYTRNQFNPMTGDWMEVFAMETDDYIRSPASSEFSIAGMGWAFAGTQSQTSAWGQMLSYSGESCVMGMDMAYASGSGTGTTITARASVKPSDLFANARTEGGDPVDDTIAAIRMVKATSLAAVKTQPVLAVDAAGTVYIAHTGGFFVDSSSLYNGKEFNDPTAYAQNKYDACSIGQL